ncbi:FMN-dependent NADH-azoreductase [Polymorphobacter sp.]|uniref:FMN-dependent NADH-azoreductase n=1 Tax=Polymorphobacter sp. TaxID=1909290 RepID=UPI003F6F43DF
MKILHIQASPRGPRSRSTMVADHLLTRLAGAVTETLDVFDPLPEFDNAAIEARYAIIHGERADPESVAAWEEIRRLVDHFLSFETLLFTVPMWNFGIPYRLKHYIDLLTQPGLAFSVTPDGNVNGHAAGRTAIIIAAGALDTTPGSPLAGLDHQVAYMQAWLGFIGVGDVHIIRVQPTYGGPEVIEAAMARGYAEAEALAERLSRPSWV